MNQLGKKKAEDLSLDVRGKKEGLKLLAFVHLGRKNTIYYNKVLLNMVDINPATVMRYHSTCLILAYLVYQFIKIIVY